MAWKKVVLCKLNEDYCPTVERMDDGKIRIGEAPEFAYLTADQWNLLVGNIKNGDLSGV